MASQLDIIINARNNASAALKQVAADAEAMGKGVEEAGADLANVGTKAEAGVAGLSKLSGSGRETRNSLMAVSEVASLMGGNLGAMVQPAAGAAFAVSHLASAFEDLGTVAMTAGIGAAVVAVGLLVQKLESQHEATVKAIEANDRYLASMQRFAQGNAEAAASIQKIADAMASWREMGSTNPFTRIFGGLEVAKIQIDDFFASLDKGIVRFRSLQEIQDAEKNTLDGLTAKAREATAFLENYNEVADKEAMAAAIATARENDHALALDYVAAAAHRAADAMGDTRAEAVKDSRDNSGLINKNGADYEFLPGLGWVTHEQAAASQKATQQWVQDQQAMRQKLQSLVENALSPTQVTDQDKKDTAAGKYMDKWDEFRRRAEAVANGADAASFGADFKKQLDALGMSAEQAAKSFQDFSLFANPDNIKLVNMAPIVDQVKHQLDEMIGKAHLTAAAMKEVWKNLSPQEKQALADQGIKSTADAIAKIEDPAGAAQKQVDGLNNAISNVPLAKTTTFDVKKAPSFDPTLQTILDDLAKIPSAADVVVTITYNSSGSLPPDNSGNTSSAGDTSKQNFASGGMFVVPPGFPNDTYSARMNLTSGERVTVTPAGRVGDWNGGSAQPIYISIDGSPWMRAYNAKLRSYAAHGY